MTLEIKGEKYQINYKKSLSKYQNTTNKEKIIEKKLNIKLDDIIKKQGIRQFILKSNEILTTYEINGIPYIIISKKLNIIDTIKEKLNEEKIKTIHDLENQIDDILLAESYKYPKNETIINPKNLTIEKADILDIIKTKTNQSAALWINPSSNTPKGIVVVYDDYWKPVIIHSLTLNKINDIEFPKEQNNTISKEKMLNDNLINIYLNLIKHKQLTQNQTLLINTCDKESIPFALKPLYKEIINLYKKNEKRKNKNAYIEAALIIFLSGLLTGTLIITIFKLTII